MTSSTPLGRLEQVDLREVWLSEPSDLTPWLAQDDNLALLADTLGLDLELDGQEKDVGPWADIVCKETTDGTIVLIENQLEKTDDTHLGQRMTYAAGLAAVTKAHPRHLLTVSIGRANFATSATINTKEERIAVEVYMLQTT